MRAGDVIIVYPLKMGASNTQSRVEIRRMFPGVNKIGLPVTVSRSAVVGGLLLQLRRGDLAR